MNSLYMPLRVPKRYSDCETGGFNAARPCTYQCKYLLPEGKCCLDQANDGAKSLKKVAELMGEDIDAIESVERRALEKLKRFQLLKVFHDA